MKSLSSIAIVALLGALAGCKSHPLTDYRPLDQAGMWSSSMEDLKKLDVNDAEIAQVVALKHAGVNDDMCVSLVQAAHDHQHPFASAAAASSLNGAGFNDEQILAIARNDQLDSLSGDAVMLRLVGLSDPTVEWILQRRMKGLPTISGAEIGRLKNTGLTEAQIMERVNRGMTDAEADREAAVREANRNHANTGFTRVKGRRH